MIYYRKKSNCAICPFKDHRKVPGQGELASKIILLGEAPGENEEREGKPFVGKAGGLLNFLMYQAGGNRFASFATNVIPCRPPNNLIDLPEAQEAIGCCRGGLEEELDYLIRGGAQAIIAFGGTALQALTGESQITKYRGSVYLYKGIPVIPTYHPSYLNRMKRKEADATISFDEVVKTDIRKAIRLSQTTYIPPKENFIYRPTPTQLREFLKGAGEFLGVDVETRGGIRWDTSFVDVIGIARSPEDAISIPIYWKGGTELYYKNGEWVEIKTLLEEAFATHTLIMQNGLFDVRKLKRAGFKIEYSMLGWDTILMHHTISPEMPQNLGFITSIYGDTPYWKDGLYATTDEDRWKYNLRDSVVLLQIYQPLHEDLEEDGLLDFYREEVHPLLEPIDEIQTTGLLYDPSAMAPLKKSYQEIIAAYEKDLRALWNLPPGFNLSSDEDMRWLFYGQAPNKFKKLDELARYVEGPDNPRPLKKDTNKYRDLLLLQGVRDDTVLFEVKGGYRARSTKGGKMSVNEKSILGLQRTIGNRLDDLAQLKTPHEEEMATLRRQLDFITIHRQYVEYQQLYSTYTHYDPDGDGRVRTSLNPTGTCTGRFSSSSPNLQNIPKKRPELRRVFKAAPGHVFLSRDYKNLEVVVLAYETNDIPLIELFAAGANIHDDNTRVLFALEPTSPLWKLARAAAKIFQFGGISYGGSDNEILDQILLEVPELGLTMKRFREAKGRWFLAHPGVSAWQDRIRKDVHITRKTRTFTGRVRTLYGAERDIEKMALNTPIQGGAASIVNRAMVRTYWMKERERLLSKLVLQIHDQLIFEVPYEEVPRMITLTREGMEYPIDFYGTPRTFKTELAIGPNLCDLKDIKDEEAYIRGYTPPIQAR